MTDRPGSRSRRLIAVVACVVALVTACSDDDGDEASGTTATVPETDATQDATATDTAAGGVADEYCALIEEIGEELPTDEQLDQLLSVAPPEISDNLAVVAEAVREDGEGAFDDPEVAANFPAIEAYESTNCNGEAPAEIDPEAQLVPVAATEYAFDLGSEPEAGSVSFAISNEGDEPHEASLARLVGDTELEDAFAAEDPVAEGLVEDVGFARSFAPGTDAVLNADLTDGRYVLICFVPAPDGVPHAEKGMVTEFAVG